MDRFLLLYLDKSEFKAIVYHGCNENIKKTSCVPISVAQIPKKPKTHRTKEMDSMTDAKDTIFKL